MKEETYSSIVYSDTRDRSTSSNI